MATIASIDKSIARTQAAFDKIAAPITVLPFGGLAERLALEPLVFPAERAAGVASGLIAPPRHEEV